MTLYETTIQIRVILLCYSNSDVYIQIVQWNKAAYL